MSEKNFIQQKINSKMWYTVHISLTLIEVCFVCANYEALRALSESNYEFTNDLYKEIGALSNENLIFSPISIQTCLVLTLEGARGTTALELLTALSLPPRSTTQAAMMSLNMNFSTNKLTLRSANKLYVAENYEILDSFFNLARDVYRSDVEGVDFFDGDGAAEIINQWVEENTEKTIKNLVDPAQIDDMTKIVLINALYFKARWEIPFKPKLTRLETFHTSGVEKPVPMMNLVDYFDFFDSPDMQAQFLDMKYYNSNISMTFILPYEENGLVNIEDDLEDYLKVKNFENRRGAVKMPKFNITNLINFKEILQELGVVELFQDTADLTGISEKQGLFVKEVIQKAFIGVSESGTEAAAATAVIAGARIAPERPTQPEFYFTADHPFLFYLTDNISGIILFIGRYVG